MLSHSLQDGIPTWTSPNGELRLHKPANHVLVSWFRGPLYDLDFAQKVIEAIEAQVFAVPRSDIFHDWEGMELYVTEARTLMTEQGVRLLPRGPSFSVLLGSKLVRMGVSMASLQMGGALRMFTVREEFDAAVRQSLKLAGKK
jgi:hypothetical protein